MIEMSGAVGVGEFGFMAGVPVKAGKPSPLHILSEMRELSKEHGLLVPSSLSAAILGVTRRRVYELIEQGILKQVRAGAVVLITEQSLLAYASKERKAGRPVGSVRKKKLWQAACEFGDEVCKK